MLIDAPAKSTFHPSDDVGIRSILTSCVRLCLACCRAAPWAGPGAVLAGWMIWPGLTDNFKQEAFGLSSSAPAAVAAAAPAASTFRAGGKYKYVRAEIGERPTLEDDE